MAFQVKNAKGIADVVFVLDVSGSMSSVIDAVMAHIAGFVESIHTHSQMKMDVRLGLVAHESSSGQRRGVRAWDFTEQVDSFCAALAQAQDGASGDEFGLPALDYALDFDWRPNCRRFVISFTDEPVSGGQQHEFQVSQLEALRQKFADLRVNGFILAPPCPDYDQLCRSQRMLRTVLEGGALASYDFGKFFSAMGKTVSQAQEQQAPVKVRRNLYGI